MSDKAFLKIGNSRISFWSLSRKPRHWEHSDFQVKHLPEVEELWILSVHPRLAQKVIKEMKRRGSRIHPLGFRDLTIRPAYNTLGMDRAFNIFSAFELKGGPGIVMDFGTASTVDFYGKDGKHYGGWIAPGPKLMAKSLHQFTAQLPFVLCQKNQIQLKYGKSTPESLAAGQIHMMRGYVLEAKEMGKKILGKKFKIILTGGYTSRVGISGVYHEPQLAWKGFKALYRKGLL